METNKILAKPFFLTYFLRFNEMFTMEIVLLGHNALCFSHSFIFCCLWDIVRGRLMIYFCGRRNHWNFKQFCWIALVKISQQLMNMWLFELSFVSSLTTRPKLSSNIQSELCVIDALGNILTWFMWFVKFFLRFDYCLIWNLW